MNDDPGIPLVLPFKEWVTKTLVEIAASEFHREAIRKAHVRAFFWSALIWLPLGAAIGWSVR